MSSVIQPRRGTAAQAASNNPILAMGEVGYETDTGREKRGNGVDHWNDLPYTLPPAPLAVSRPKSGGTYPTRIAGAMNIFKGDTDPGLAMDPDKDLWANPNLTTLDSVAASAETNGTPLNLAIKSANNGNSLWVTAGDVGFLDADVTRGLLTSGGFPALFLPPALPRSMRTMVNLPAGWSSVWFDIYWTHQSASHAATIRWSAGIYPLVLSSDIPAEASVVDTRYTAAANEVDVNEFTVTTPTAPVSCNPSGGPTGLRIMRLGHLSTDTFTGAVALLGIRMRKAS